MILFLRFLSFRFDWEDISNSHVSVWPNFQTTQSLSKILCYASNFKLSSRSFKVWSNTLFCVWYITLKTSRDIILNSVILSLKSIWTYVQCHVQAGAIFYSNLTLCKQTAPLTHRDTVAGEASVKSLVSNISLTNSDRYSLSPFNKFRYWKQITYQYISKRT